MLTGGLAEVSNRKSVDGQPVLFLFTTEERFQITCIYYHILSDNSSSTHIYLYLRFTICHTKGTMLIFRTWTQILFLGCPFACPYPASKPRQGISVSIVSAAQRRQAEHTERAATLAGMQTSAQGRVPGRLNWRLRGDHFLRKRRGWSTVAVKYGKNVQNDGGLTDFGLFSAVKMDENG